MTARLRARRSRLAGWSRWLGTFAVPVLAIAVLIRHFGLIDPVGAIGAVALASAMGLVALVMGIAALVGIWRDGRRGLGSAARGIVLGAIAIAPLAFAAWGVLAFPRLEDVTSDIADPPAYPVDTRAGLFAANSFATPSPILLDRQRAAYPDIVSRRFPLPPALLFEAARLAVKEKGWQVVHETLPQPGSHVGVLQAVARSLILRFPDDVVVRVTPDSYGSRLDIRSSSRYGRHDLGANAARIRAFFAATDDILSETFGQQAPDDAEAGVDSGDAAAQPGSQ